MTDQKFRRARTDEQREVRRTQILDVTRQLIIESRVRDVSLNEIARQVGLAKSNVLRYFGSREAILLVLLDREYEGWVGDCVDQLSGSTDHDVAQVARVLARTVAARPLLCELLSVVTTVLEHNVTVEEVLAFKPSMAAHMARLLDAVVVATGSSGLAESDRGLLLTGLHAMIAELWSLAHPAPVLVEAAALDPRVFGGLDDVEGTLAASLTMLLRGALR